MDQSKGEWRNMEMPNVSNKIVFELDMIIEVPGSSFYICRCACTFVFVFVFNLNIYFVSWS
jgi:hypothetical protein